MSGALQEAPSNDVAVIIPMTADVIFAPGGMDACLDLIARKVRAVKTDISTPKGRAAVKKLARTVASSKTWLDDEGKRRTDEWRSKTDLVNADRRKARAFLDALRDEVIKPVDEFEAAEEARVKGHEDALSVMRGIASPAETIQTPEQIDARLVQLDAAYARDWQVDFRYKALDVYDECKAELAEQRRGAVAYVAAQAEQERQRRETEAREQAEAAERQRVREEQIAQEAATRAREAAEREAAEAAQRAAEAAEAERQAILRREQEALEQAAHAEAQLAAQAAQAEADRLDAQRRAQEAADAAERAARARVIEAVAAEQRRVDQENAAAAAAAEAARIEAERKAADKAHRGSVNGSIVSGLVLLGVAEEQAKAIVAAVARGQIAHIIIQY